MTSQIERSGDYIARQIGPIPALVVRDEEGRINAFANVCQHRGAQIVDVGCGHAARLRCPYHAWTYALDGSLRNAPRAERNEAFDSEGIALRRLRAETLGPLIFVNADADAEPLAESYDGWLDGLERRDRTPSLGLRLHAVREYLVEANWKVVCENGFECYHCPACHPSFSATVDVTADFVFEEHDSFTFHGFPSEYIREGSTQRRAVLSFLWPNFSVIARERGLVSTFQKVPLDVGHSIYRREYWAADDIADESRDAFVELLDAADLEDVAILPRVQVGLASGFFESGPLLLPVTEAGVHFFQQRVQGALGLA
jgi:choline monooxygenase